MKALAVTTALVPFDSQIDNEILQLKSSIREVKEAISTLTQEFEDLIAHYRTKSPDLCALMSDLMRKLEDNENRPPPPEIKKKTKQRVKEQYRRVSALAHPDRTQSFSTVIRDQLTTIFICAKQAYDKLDLATLIHLTDEAARIRSTYFVQDTLDNMEMQSLFEQQLKEQVSYQEDKYQTLAILRADYAVKVSELEDLKHTTMWQVKRAHDAKDFQKAFELHRMLFMENIGVIGDKLQAQIMRQQQEQGRNKYRGNNG